MAKLILQGSNYYVELSRDNETGEVIATCQRRMCSWTERYDTLNDAAEYAADHADGKCIR